MKQNLDDFNKIVMKNENTNNIVYEDEKGNYFTIALAPKYQHIAQLLLNCEYVEASEVEFKKLLFNKDIDKDMEFKKEKVSRPVPKSQITGKEKDMSIIVDQEIEVSKIWIVRNGFKITKSFNNKDEALKYIKDFNNEVINKVGIDGVK